MTALPAARYFCTSAVKPALAGTLPPKTMRSAFTQHVLLLSATAQSTAAGVLPVRVMKFFTEDAV